MTDNKIEILYNHYVDTYANVRASEKQRNNLFLGIVLLLGLLLIGLIYSTDVVKIVKQIQFFGLNIDLNNIPLPVLISSTWTIFSIISIRYYQEVVHVDKLYTYIHKLEEKLSLVLGEANIISRENSGYLTKKFSLFRNCVWYFYTAIYPVIVILVVLWNLLLEWSISSIPVYHKYYDSTIGTLSIIFLLLYLIGQWFEI